MNGYSEDLRRRIVSAVESATSKSPAARTFDVSLSSVKRYVNKAGRGESLAPKKSSGSAPKLGQNTRGTYSSSTRLVGAVSTARSTRFSVVAEGIQPNTLTPGACGDPVSQPKVMKASTSTRVPVEEAFFVPSTRTSTVCAPESAQCWLNTVLRESSTEE
jgi:hypothetical protein